ncbi:putative proline dehydrogenase [Halobacteriovorax marinus SJ]|uniref:L-glutamate gamma-semialdehyde dehydrogenase n=1 Tax=Halobacteriovorax marinus (strain ATCC BAA-682 / DSM 15412 / SJ) TaxID=862908 RepID=E1X343_HALMS|nr:proline dehydrogenase family protein [Halobacteriovorax marinus]CBW26873.1 putative proline dehydrogenase [Halobacteriovorax marinus SJ]
MNSEKKLNFKEFLIPNLLTFALDDWKVIFNCDFEKSLVVDSQLDSAVKEELAPFTKLRFGDFRQQIILKSAPYLVGFFYDVKEIRIYSPMLSYEFFIIPEMERICEQNEVEAFKSHTEMAASLSSREFPSIFQLTTKKYQLTDLLEDTEMDEIEQKSSTIIDELLIHLNKYTPSLFERVSDYGLGLTAQFALLRIHLLKFLAILPSLDHDLKGREVKRILLEALRRLLSDSLKAKRLGLKGQNKALPKSLYVWVNIAYYICKICPPGLLAFSVRFKVRFMAKRFIAGETIETAEQALSTLASTGRDVTLDQLGELVVSEKEADHYCDEVIKLIKGYSLHVKKGELNAAGINRAHVSIKVSALCSDFKPYAFDYTYEHVAPRLKKILLIAKEEDVFINIDAEHYDYRDIVFKVYRKVLLETEELKDYKATGIVLQAYLRDAYKHLLEIVELAKERGIIMPIRLVKGAYWDAETVEADAHSFDAPEFLNKEETDLHFRQIIIKIFDFNPHVQLCLASHNFSDHAFAEALRENKYKDLPIIEHQCLHMTYEALSTAMAKMGWVVRNYVPIGALIVGMAYLVRRIMENSSQVGVLTIMRSHKKNISLVTPKEIHKQKIGDGHLERDKTQTHLLGDFTNITPVRTYLDSERKWTEDELEKFKGNLGKHYANDFLKEGVKQTILSSSNPDIKVGDIIFADASDAKRAVEVCDESYNSGAWANADWAIRASTLLRAANLMLARRNELSALIVYEAGKAINEALADVDEAVDFLNFYAREEARIQSLNDRVESRGVSAVISPWNFPLAIPCGMVVSSLVVGNTVILKSAEQTPLISQELVDILHQAGVPKDVLIHLPGLGEIVGDALVTHERVSTIVFTGSKNVGTLIASKAHSRIYENKLTKASYPVRVITEMGGKNAVIVTANAELDETVAGILYSSFGHAGQKCSAASRVLVDNAVKDRLIERLKEACLDIEVGEAYSFRTTVNPVITQEDKQRLIAQVNEAQKEANEFGGKVHVNRSSEELPGYCVGPSLIELPISRALNPESYAMRELFGPVVHIIGFNHLDQALRIYNGTDYALTGGVFSQSQDDIDYLTARMESGNIYVNRSITGARVAIEPFGGFKMSGTGPNAGSRSYLSYLHRNPVREFTSCKSKKESGSEYTFESSRPSGLSGEGRVQRMDKVVSHVIRHFEHLFSGIRAEEKQTLSTFHKWLNVNYESFLNREHWNRRIPGQLSYCDYTQGSHKALVAAFRTQPDFEIVFEVILALVSGAGITVNCRNNEAYDWWMGFRDILVEYGISKENFDVYFVSEELLKKSLGETDLKHILIDGTIEDVAEISKWSYENYKDHKHMRNIISKYDMSDINDFKRICRQYVNIRSFAVNTMRHGAPMDVVL